MPDVETTEISALLSEICKIKGSESASAARVDLILNANLFLCILHVAGHGHLLTNPNAMECSIELDPDVSVTALDMRGARAFIAPTTYISPAGARAFANLFYRAALGNGLDALCRLR